MRYVKWESKSVHSVAKSCFHSRYQSFVRSELKFVEGIGHRDTKPRHPLRRSHQSPEFSSMTEPNGNQTMSYFREHYLGICDAPQPTRSSNWGPEQPKVTRQGRTEIERQDIKDDLKIDGVLGPFAGSPQ
jgi:hypothetical protein